ncbi:hypothetical protein Pcinc_020737 [Petrolisthes cinctipes]|uniref:xanthine dehydrogenase n=1 Tax=Petrolisthes cinctipes TaxID=88211 RepID=A0AAE1FIH6_PETCI|nr:hypothetical protein Pcinc_020737 [Petrolisthes cinctipes]
MEQLDEYFTGNLCRCTGYRPILDAYRTFTSNGTSNGTSVDNNSEVVGGGCGKADCCRLMKTEGVYNNGIATTTDTTTTTTTTTHDGEWSCREGRHLHQENDFTPYDPTSELIFPPELKVRRDLDDEYLVLRGRQVTYHRPTSFTHLIHLKHLHPAAKIIVGNTEVGVETKFKQCVYPVLINPTSVKEVTQVTLTNTGVQVGAAVTLTTLQEALILHTNSLPEYQTRVFSAILEMLRWFAGKQIKNAAALGGNIMTSSPISDLNPLLMAAGATLTLNSTEGGERKVALDQHFFTAYRRNIVQPEEVLVSVHIPFTTQNEYFHGYKQSRRRDDDIAINEYFHGYKQSRRRDDDIAIVNAGCCVTFLPNTTTVSKLSMAFGGMAPTTVMALRTMKELKGRAWDASLLEEGTSLLLQDLPLAPSAPGGMIEYRRALTISFFFKFYLSVRGHLSVSVPSLVPTLTSDELEVTRVHTYKHPSSAQLYEVVPEDQPQLDPIGRPRVHTSALKQTTGEAVYVDDIPDVKDQLQAAFVLSTRPHARIISIDESRALAVEGVVAFVCHRDLTEEQNQLKFPFDDEKVFASDKVTCVGHVIGLVCAEDRKTAQTAAKLVDITYEDLPAIITIQDAIKAKSWWEPKTIIKGDVNKHLNNNDNNKNNDNKNNNNLILQGEMHMGGQEHFYLETNAHLATPGKEDGEMEIYSSTQNPTLTQMQTAHSLGVDANKVVCRTAHSLGVDANKVVCRVKRMGGGFGGKETRTIVACIPICVAARKLGRCVRVALERDEDMVMTGGRHPFFSRWKVGFTAQGVLTALDMDVYANGGHTIDLTASVLERCIFSLDSGYNLGAVRICGHACKTNLPSNTAFRAFGGPQGMLFMEDIMSRVAAYLNIDSTLIRQRNLYQTGDLTHCNQLLENCTLRRCWQEVLEQADYSTRCQRVRDFNSNNRYRKRGLAVIPVKFGIAYTALFLNQAGALVLVYADGSVLLSHGGTEMGQGLHTKMIQIASRVLQIAPEYIHIAETSTDKVPNTSPTAGSASSDLNGMAIVNACETIMCRLEPIIASNPKGTWKDWVSKAYMERISLSSTGFYKTPDLVPYNFEKNEGRIFNYFSFGAAVTETEIDCLTGDHTVLRTDIVMDVGDSLNPAIDIGQVEGAFTQGQGLYTMEELLWKEPLPRDKDFTPWRNYCIHHKEPYLQGDLELIKFLVEGAFTQGQGLYTMEELLYSPQGALLTRGPGAYKIPGFQDIPREFNVSLLRGAPNPRAVFSSKAIGEPPLCLASSVFFSIKQAIAALRSDQQQQQQQQQLSPVFRLDSPATAERIRMACQDFITAKIETSPPGSFKPWSVRV